LLQIILFSVLSLIGLGLRYRELMMIGSIILIIGSVGPVVYFVSSIPALIGMTILGGALITLAILFHLLTFIAWYRN
ncbi:MAG: hypothetical protein P1Q69_13730, partial [Candidatus Thorarchaeota archaeon]|nr:hypothetical protein [Candidatus Thorarchaeota archaeon]